MFIIWEFRVFERTAGLVVDGCTLCRQLAVLRVVQQFRQFRLYSSCR